MAKPKFSIADFAAPAVSDLDHLEVRLLPWADIRGNAGNFYSVDDVEELVNSIRIHGLLDPVVVMADPDPEAADAWVLVSGHRRHKAWGILREEDPEKYAAIPAVVREFESAAMAELALIMANSASRKLTPAEISHQAERVEMLFYELKELGYEFPGRMRDQVAAACQVSSTKLARLKVIREHLSDGWMPEWERGKLSESAAYELAQMDALLQERIRRVKPDVNGVRLGRVRQQAAEGVTWSCEGLCCPNGKPCGHGDACLRRALEDHDGCDGTVCCLQCNYATRDWYPCDRMCARAKERRSEKRAAEKAKEEKAEAKRRSKLQRAVAVLAQRLVRAADAAGVGDDVVVRFNRYGSIETMKTVREWAEDPTTYNRYGNELDPESMANLPELARTLNCSADYLVGLTDELTPGNVSKSDHSRETPGEADPAQQHGEAVRRWRRCSAHDPEDGQTVILLTEGVDGGYWTARLAVYREDRDDYEDMSGFALAAGGCDLTADGEAYWIPAPDIPSPPPARG